MEHTGVGVTTGAIVSFALLRFGLRATTVEGYLHELRTAGAIRFERDGWHTTQKAREFFK